MHGAKSRALRMNNHPVSVALIHLNFGQFSLFTFEMYLVVVVVVTLAVFVKYDVFYG